MATPVDGPSLLFGDYTWGSKFGWVGWYPFGEDVVGPVEATTTEGSLLLTGRFPWSSARINYYFSYNQDYGEGDLAYIDSNIAGSINNDYIPVFTGKILTPGGQGQPDTPMPYPPGAYITPGPPVAIEESLCTTTSVQQIENPPYVYYYRGIDGIEGFTEHGPAA